MISLTGKNFIGNKISGDGASRFFGLNPANRESLEPEYAEATKDEVAEACKLAQHAFKEYAAKSPAQRADFLDAIAEALLETGDELIDRCMKETALPQGRLQGERMRTVNQLRMFASLLREGSWVNARIDVGDPGRSPMPKPDVRQVQRPLGPVGVFGASNFPLAFSVAGGDTASAMAAGCPVVVKGHPLHPGTSEMVGRVILKAAEATGMPNGVFSLIHGTSHEAGMHIVNDPNITAIGFTGSFQGGKAIFDAANQRATPIPVYAEMGSINPVFILPGAYAERHSDIASGLAASVTLGVGQFCTNPGLVVSESAEFSADLESAFASSSGGVMLSSAIRDAFDSKVSGFINTKGVELLAKTNEADDKAAGMVFTTNSETFMSHPKLSEEVFGPSTIHVTAESKSALVQIAENLEGHLTATVHGTEQDLEDYAELLQVLERKVGRIIFNGYPTGVEVCHAMHHGGPFPATTAPQTTSVGTMAIYRFTKPVCFQDFPDRVLPDELKDANPLKIMRLVNGTYTSESI